jgi:hypothetical protein
MSPYYKVNLLIKIKFIKPPKMLLSTFLKARHL